MASMQAGHAVGLGDLPGVPRQRRARAQGGEHPALRAGLAAADLGDGLRGGQGRRAADAASSTPRCAACCTRRWTPAPAAGRPSACCRPGRRRCSATTTARRCRPTSCTTRPAASSPRCWPSATTASCRCCWSSGDNARDQRLLRGAGHASAAGRCIMNVVQAFDDRPAHPSPHARLAEELPRARHPRVRPGRSRPTPASPSPSRTGTCSTTPQAWCEATTGTREERLAKLADPARRAGAARQAADHRDRAAAADRHRRPEARQEQEVARLHAGPCRREDGQASGRRHARHGGRGGSRDRVLRRPAQRQDRVPEGAGRRSRTCCSACPTAAPTPSS